MALSIAAKLKIKPGTSLLTINAPAGFTKELGKLPVGIKVSSTGNDYNQVHWFVKDRAQLEKEMSRVMKLLREAVTVWVYYPKGSSGIQTDLTRDKGWDCLLSHGDRLTWIALISFNDTWSVFGFRTKTEAEKKKDAMPKPEREIFKWIDAVKKTVKLPEELAAAFKKDKTATAAYEALSFSNKKEYVEWVITAKRAETKAERIIGTVERLKKGWKNPRNI